MNAWVVFRRARIILFSFLVFLCLTWATLFAVFLAHEWSHFSEHQKIVVVCSLSLYGFTAILLYLMAVVHFCLWWDVARIVSLLVIHVGSSVVFTLYRPRFPCRGFDTEVFCKDFVFAIFIGSWIISGMIFCFSIALGIMTLLPRPVESLSGSEEAELPPSPASFKAGSLFSEGRPPSFHSFDPRMGLVPYDDKSEFLDESLSPARTPVLVNGAPQESPRLWQSLQTQRLRNSTDGPIYANTITTRTDSPVKSASADVKTRHVNSLYLNPFSAPSPPPLPVYSPASETGNGPPSVSPGMPCQLSTAPEPMYGARAAASDSIHHHHAAPYTPTIYTDPNAHSFSATFRESHQPHHMYPDLVHTAMPRIYSFHSAAASVHSKWPVSPSHILPPRALTLGVAHPKQPSEFLYLQSLPSTYHVQNTILKRHVSEPNRTVPNHGGGLARRSYTLPATLPVTEGSLQRRGSDGQVVDHAQWQRLVLGAAAMP